MFDPSLESFALQIMEKQNYLVREDLVGEERVLRDEIVSKLENTTPELNSILAPLNITMFDLSVDDFVSQMGELVNRLARQDLTAEEQVLRDETMNKIENLLPQINAVLTSMNITTPRFNIVAEKE